MSRARNGVIGAGFWASYQCLPFYRDHPEVELVGTVRKDEAGLDAFRKEFGLELSTSSVDARAHLLGLIAYFATAAEYAHGGYEADYSCRGHGNPSHVSPACERILVETGCGRPSLFPEARPWDGGRGWTATGDVPGPLPLDRQVHPDRA